jgi:hypothetical protein
MVKEMPTKGKPAVGSSSLPICVVLVRHQYHVKPGPDPTAIGKFEDAAESVSF